MTPHPPTDPTASTESLAALLDKDDATNRLIARHPKAGAALLEKLSHSSDRTTRALVTANPDTPSAVYLRLGAQFPSEFLANPMLDLLFLERPALLQELPDTLLVQVLRRPKCPQDFLVWAAVQGSEKVQLAVAMNAKAPQEAIGRLHNSVYEAVKEAVSHMQFMTVDAETAEPLFRQAVKDRLGSLSFSEAEKAWKSKDIGLSQLPYLSAPVRLLVAGMSEDQLDALNQEWRSAAENPRITTVVLDVLAKDTGEDARRRAAENPSTTTAVLEVLAKDKDMWVRCYVAVNPNTPIALLEDLAKDKDSNVRSSVAGHAINTPVALLEELAKDKDPTVRMSVATYPSSPIALLEELSKDEDYRVRSSVAENPNTPLALLKELAKDKDEYVRYGFTFRPSTAVPFLEELATDEVSAAVRCGVAKHPNTPVAVLEMLAKDKEMWVRSNVAQNRNTPVALFEVLANDEDYRVRSSVAENPNTPVIVLEVLAKDKSTDVRRSVAEHPNAPAVLLEVQIRDEDQEIRQRVAKDPNIPVAMLKVLAKDKDSGVRKCIAVSPNTPAAMLKVLAKDKDSSVRKCIAVNPNTPVGVLEELERDMDTGVRKCIAWNPNTPAAMLKVLAKDKDSGVRKCIAVNPNTPVAALEALVKDKSTDVRRSVAEHPNAPGAVLEALVKDKSTDVRRSVAEHPNAPGAVLEVLAKDKDAEVRSVIAENPRAPEVILQELANDASWDVRCKVISNVTTPPVLADKVRNVLLYGDLRQDPWYLDALNKADAATRKAVADDNSLFFQVEDPDRRVLSTRMTAKLAGLCSGPYVTPEHIARVSGSTDWLIRAAVARNVGTPLNLLNKLTADGHPLVAGLAKLTLSRASRFASEVTGIQAKHGIERIVAELVSRLRGSLTEWMGNAPVALLEVLAKDKDAGARCFVAEHPNTPPTVLEMLAMDQYSAVRLNVAEHANTRVAVLEVLAKDKDSTIRRSIAKHPNTPVAVLEMPAKNEDFMVRSCVAKHPDSPVAVLEMLAKDAISTVRSCVATHPCTPVAVLEILAKDEYPVVRRSVATHPGAAIAVLESLAQDEDADVRNSVAGIRKPPVAVREVLAESEECVPQACLVDSCHALENRVVLGVEPQLDDVAADYILRGVMLLCGLSRDAGYKELAAASRSTDWLIRLGAALHPAASDDQLKLLSQDADADVAAAAVMSHLRGTVPTAPAKLAALVAPCPTCKGLVKEGPDGYACVGAPDGQQEQGCGFAFKKTHAGRTFTVGEAEQLVRDGRIGPLMGFISKAGAPFTAQMCFMFNNSSQNYRLQFDFGKDSKSDQAVVNVDISNQTPLGQCPKCSGAVYEQEQDYVCINSVASPTNPKPSCNFKTGKVVLQQPISQEQVGKLLSTGRTDLLDGFVSSRTQKKFEAMLVWDAQAGKVSFEFVSA